MTKISLTSIISILFLVACNLSINLPSSPELEVSSRDGFLVRYHNSGDFAKGNSSLFSKKGEYQFGGIALLWVEPKEGISDEELINFFISNESVSYIEANHKYKTLSNSNAIIPSDPYWSGFNYAKDLCKQIDALAAYGVGENQSFAVIVDTGINMLHEDLAALRYLHDGTRINTFFGWSAFTKESLYGIVRYTAIEETVQMKTNGVDVEVLNYIDINDDNRGFWDVGGAPEGHGTHVAGILGAPANGVGIVGACPRKLSLGFYKVFAVDSAESFVKSQGGSALQVYSSLVHLVSKRDSGSIEYGEGLGTVPAGQTIPVNFSIGSNVASKIGAEFVNYATENNLLLICASGNDSFSGETFPAAYTATMSVGAVDHRGIRSQFLREDQQLSVVAPGKDIFSSKGGPFDNQDYYEVRSGSSMAAPYVTGLAAYLLTFDPTLTPGEVRTVIEESANNLGGADDVGHGLVNFEEAVIRVKSHMAGEELIVSRYMNQSLIIKQPDSLVQSCLYVLLKRPLGSVAEEKYKHHSISMSSERILSGEAQKSFAVSFPMLTEGEYKVVSPNLKEDLIFAITASDITATEQKIVEYSVEAP